MLTFLVVVLVSNAMIGVTSPLVARGLAPCTATRLIGVAAFVTTLASGFVLCIVCFDFVTQIPTIARVGRWSAGSFNSDDPVPVACGLACCLVLLAVVVLVIRRSAALAGDLWSSAAACRRFPPFTGQLVVVDDPEPDAYALPGWRGGHIVVTSGMLGVLDADEQQVLLAHEASHLRHRHHAYVALATLAAAANPLCRAVPAVVRTSAERWADEDAAQATGDRRLAARAVARAGLESAKAKRAHRGTLALGMSDSQVAQRAKALMAPPAPTRPLSLAVAAALVLVTMVGAFGAALTTEHRFERAHASYLQQ
ncbi:MAG: M56 family metallopeptidase [Actinomycetia bacterium]|nr:M56 family metallopeptidase [Actinomycetes bacterium]